MKVRSFMSYTHRPNENVFVNNWPHPRSLSPDLAEFFPNGIKILDREVDIEGRVILAATENYYSEKVFSLSSENGIATICMIVAEGGDCDEEAYTSFSSGANRLEIDDLHNLKLLTDEQHKQVKAAREEAKQKKKEFEERKKFEELKLKFGDKQNA